MRKSSRILLGGAVAVVLSSAPPIWAQTDINPPAPNVMLLVDTSGSMEYKSSSSSFPTCDPTGGTASERSRWIELVEIMTGSVAAANYRCEAIDRSSASFNTEYSMSGTSPADRYYQNPYHRIMSSTCAPGPGSLASPNVFSWPATPINYHVYNNTATSCAFAQNDDGLLDNGAFRSNVRFGLMTFDTLTDAGRGYSGTAADYSTGTQGTWSYYWGSSAVGRPAGCATDQPQEVGARNGAAPPWEGRMMNFGAYAAAPETQNDRIQQVLMMTRPYGATPIAGMLDDARDFFWNDTSDDPVTVTQKWGPKDDPYVLGSCRKNFIILLSDGEPNLDLRPSCEGTGGVCPFDKPEDIALDLASAAGTNAVKTFVVGFAVSNVTLSDGVTTVDCEQLGAFDLTNPAGKCATMPNESQLQACCTLSKIAYNGGTDRAYFANDQSELRAALSNILSSLSANTSSRTLPVMSSATGTSGDVASFRFSSSFVPSSFSLWKGVLERKRFVCEASGSGPKTPVGKPIDKTVGDDFVSNVNSGTGPARTFWTVVRDTTAGAIHSTRTVRPYIGTDVDGLGAEGGTAVWGDALTFNNNTPPEAMSLTGTSCTGLTAAQCRDRYLQWITGYDTVSAYARCKTPGTFDCNLIGDIYHSTPRVVTRPGEFLPDETYTLFSLQNAKRHTVLYTSTNDGFLHAFKVAQGDPTDTSDTVKVDDNQNNELWAFVPPAVLPGIPSEYPATHQTLLDGVPVVQDVVAIYDGAANRYKYERSAATARAGGGEWRTVLIQSFGGNRGGYFAIDITDPKVAANPSDPQKGPKFLWQLTEDSSGNPIFGKSGSTPLITTLFVDVGGSKTEVAVAVLPGGEDPDPPTGSSTTRINASAADIDTTFPPRGLVPAYGSAEDNQAARSLTIVRLDNGEVIRSLRVNPDKPTGLKTKGKTLAADFDSPITGVPVAFPGTTGSIADRIFVGDRDGSLWRIDVASADPSQWKAKLFLDAYSGKSWDAGQPVATPPVLSVDLTGNVTVAFSTGNQDTLVATTGQKNYVYAMTENTTATAFESHVNWFVELDNSERVTGPMSLFNGALYFTSYTPESPTSTNVCGEGASRVWGMDYLLPKVNNATLVSDLAQGGKERLPDTLGGFVQYLDQTASMLSNAGVIFGVGVSAVPSCTDETNVTDPYFGTGKTHTRIDNISPGSYQLVMQVSGTGNVADNSQTQRVEIALPTPPSSTRIDSWAAIVE